MKRRGLFVVALIALAGCSEQPAAPDLKVSYEGGIVPTAASKDPSIALFLQATPESAVGHDFDAFIKGKNATEFVLNDDGGSDAIPNLKEFLRLRSGTYEIAITAGGSYELTSISCSVSPGGSSTASPNVPAGILTVHYVRGETVTCTFFVNEPT